jgi:hypothetical protein
MTLHLVRTTPPPPAAIAPTDWVAHRAPTGWHLATHGDPPLPPGPLDHAGLATLVLAAARTITW